MIDQLEIAEAIEAGTYEISIEVLLESKRLDAGNQEQLKKYSEQLIDIYKTVGDFDVSEKDFAVSKWRCCSKRNCCDFTLKWCSRL